MARPRKLFSFSVGAYGAKVTIREPRLGAPLRWDYRGTDGKRKRPEVTPRIVVRASKDDAVDPVAVRKAEDLCKQKHAELTLAPVQKATPVRARMDATTLTVKQAFALFHDPARNAMPKSRSGRTHHTTARTFWETNIGTNDDGTERLWNDVLPNDIEAPLLNLAQKDGKVQTAIKRLQTLRTVTRWLQRKMRLRGLEDPTIGVEVKDLKDGYVPRRPRLTNEEVRRLRKVLPSLSWRSQLYWTLLIPSGTRAIQARTAMRRMVDRPLEPAPPKDLAPHGWIAFGAVKGQRPHVSFFTAKQRGVIDEALSGPLAKWEAEYQAGTLADYPLLPAGRIDRDLFTAEPVSDRILRYELTHVLKQAGIKKSDRMGFHAVRRAWTDLMHEKAGMDTTVAGGGWHDASTVEESYLSGVRFGHLERARKVQEAEDE